jgi:hypothetical protein
MDHNQRPAERILLQVRARWDAWQTRRVHDGANHAWMPLKAELEEIGDDRRIANGLRLTLLTAPADTQFNSWIHRDVSQPVGSLTTCCGDIETAINLLILQRGNACLP